MLRFLGWCLLLIVGFVVYANLDPTTPTDRAHPEDAKMDDAQCVDNVDCWYRRNEISAKAQCQTAVERSAKYDTRWTDGVTTPRFKPGTVTKSTGDIMISGDELQIQNGNGAWQRMSYTCTYNPSKNTTSVYMQEGRRPDD